MKKIMIILLVSFCSYAFCDEIGETKLDASSSDNTAVKEVKVETSRPDNFVDIKSVIPEIQVDMRFYSTHNFVGRQITGYKAPVCLLTTDAANALKKVEDKLIPMGLNLKLYDCYRPQMAVDEFVTWTQNANTKMKKEFYPNLNKKDMLKDGFIQFHSSHSRGSTLDLTITPLGSLPPKFNSHTKLISCEAPKNKRFKDNSLDFGTGDDCFSLIARPDYQKLDPQIKANRLLLKVLMEQAGFKGVNREWWHYTLINEPYPNTYFDFPVEK